MPECGECGDYYSLDDGCEPDGLCHQCAHEIASVVVNARTAPPPCDVCDACSNTRDAIAKGAVPDLNLRHTCKST